jgi:hypothetical protein
LAQLQALQACCGSAVLFLASPSLHIQSSHKLAAAAALLCAALNLQPIMVLGSAASTAGLLWFGMAGSYTSAAASRAVAGLLNGIIV